MHEWANTVQELSETWRKKGWLVSISDQGNGFCFEAWTDRSAYGLRVWAWDVSLHHGIHALEDLLLSLGSLAEPDTTDESA